jgi:hypothetical protein
MRIYPDRMHVGAATQVGPLSIFPVWTEARSNFAHVTAHPQGVTFGELEEPQVNRLQVINQSNRALLVPEGTVLRGARQTRTLCRDFLVLPGRSRELDVMCVEQGRWGGEGDATMTGRVPAGIIAEIRDITPQGTSGASTRQSRVWSRVNNYETRYGSRNTSSYESILNMRDEDRERGPQEFEERLARERHLISAFRAQLDQLVANPLPGQAGVMVGALGHPVLLEMFGSGQAFREQVGQILTAAVLDAPAIERIPTPTRRAHRFAEAIMDNQLVHQSATTLTGGDHVVNIRCLGPINGSKVALHTSVVNPRHELVLAA